MKFPRPLSGSGFYDPDVSTGMALATMMALILGRSTRRPPPTEAQLRAQAIRDERDAWNEQVEARKKAKKAKK